MTQVNIRKESGSYTTANVRYIPCVPSILMTLKLVRGNISQHGAFPCVGLVTLDEYLQLLGEFAVEWRQPG